MPFLDNGYARAGALGAGFVVLVVFAAVLGISGRASADHLSGSQPNVVVIVTDDQEYTTFTEKFMPKTMARLADRGTWLDNFVITTPLCCPSRAAQLTGQYGHNNGVLANKPGYTDLIDNTNVLPAWLQRAGYETAHIGKFLNGYRRSNADPNTIAPGWDIWYTSERQRYYDYTISNNGEGVYKGLRPRDYSTDVFTRKALSLVNTHFAGSDQPFYLQIDYLAPHTDGSGTGDCRLSAVPAPRDRDRYPNLRLPRGPAFNESDVSDKPRFVRDISRLGRAKIRQIKRRFVCRVRSLRAVDRGINQLVKALKDTGKLDNTVFMLYSDNGFHSGEHRVAKSKGTAYEESIHVPLIVRLPESMLHDQPPLPVVSAPTANIDLAPTILDLAGAEPCVDDDTCRVLDGRSLLPLLDNSGDPDWPADRPIAVEIAQNGELAGGTRACNYHAVRAGADLFVQHERSLDRATKTCFETDEREHYHLDSDPAELDNLYPAPPLSQLQDEQDALAELLARIHVCAGIEGRDPEPASGEYCG